MCINAFHIWAFVLWLTSWVQSALRIQRSLVFLLHFDSHFVHCVHWLLVRCVDSAGPWWHKRKESRHWDGTPDSGRSGTAVLFIAAVNCCQWLCISLRWDGTPDSGGRGGTNFSALLYSWTLRVHFTEPGWNFRWWPLPCNCVTCCTEMRWEHKIHCVESTLYSEWYVNAVGNSNIEMKHQIVGRAPWKVQVAHWLHKYG